MAILDIQVVATSLPTIQQALDYRPMPDELDPDGVSDRRDHAIPLTGWLTRVLDAALAVRDRDLRFTLTSVGCAFSTNFASLVTFRILQGFAGGTLIPAVFSGIFLLFPPAPIRLPAPSPASWPCWRRRSGRWSAAGSRTIIPGPGCSWSTSSRASSRVSRHRSCCRGAGRAEPAEEFRRHLAGADGAGAGGLEIGLKQAPQDGWFSAVCFGLFASGFAAATARSSIRTLKAVQPVVELTHAEGAAVSDRLRAQLLPRRRLVRRGLSDAGVSRLCPRQHDALQIGRSCW